jgi:molybdopterin molybdotransferase
MISLEEAQARLFALAKPLPVETVPLIDAIGCWAAESVTAKRTQPARDLSAMDGYAIASADLPGPWTVVGESAAGAPLANPIGGKEAARIFTGAALPVGTNTIIIQEDITRDGDLISISPELAISARQHVRAQGSDFRAGDILVEKGEKLNSARMALAASGNHDRVTVHRAVRVVILPTGDELVAPGSATLDTLPESNALMIRALLRDLPCTVTCSGIIPDDLELLTNAIQSAAQSADMIVTLGGASVGDHDYVRPALEACGATLDFWKVAMRPGKPVLAGTLGECTIIGLPGNPVSAFVTAILFLRPLIAHLTGANDPLPPRHAAILTVPLPATTARTDHIRAIREGETVRPIGINDSAALRALASANCLIIRPAEAPAAKAGDQVEVIDIGD